MTKRGSEVFKEKYIKCILLRKKGYSYREIKNELGIPKTTINNWLTRAGLTRTKEHLDIQHIKNLQNRRVGVEASKITRKNNRENEINSTIIRLRKYFSDPFFMLGISLYEAEGNKGDSCRFSNSDYRLILVFKKFIEKFFSCNSKIKLNYAVYLHITREADLKRILNFWSNKLDIPLESFSVYWKYNNVKNRRENKDYVGQVLVYVKGEKYMTRKLLAISSIILKQYIRN